MKLSARNQLKGTIVEIQEGAVNAIVKINVGNDNIVTADITIQSVKELELLRQLFFCIYIKFLISCY